MRRLKLALGLSLASAVALSLPDRKETPLERHLDAEVQRLQAHFDSVDVELAARDVSLLSVAQRRARTQLATWLRDYRNAASFPLNDGVSRDAVPIFRDSRGVLCAMAYLIDRSGRSDIVDDVAATRNTVSVYDLSDDPRLVAWLDSTGLSIDEAAHIQPQYHPPEGRSTVSGAYAMGSAALSGTALVTAGVNLVGPSRVSGFLGFVTGTAAMVLGVTRLDDGGSTRRLAAVNTGVGALAMALAFRGITSRTKPPAPGPVTGRLSHVQLAPTVALLGTPQVGFVMRAQF